MTPIDLTSYKPEEVHRQTGNFDEMLGHITYAGLRQDFYTVRFKIQEDYLQYQDLIDVLANFFRDKLKAHLKLELKPEDKVIVIRKKEDIDFYMQMDKVGY